MSSWDDALIEKVKADRDRYREAYTKLDTEVALFLDRISKAKDTPSMEVLVAAHALRDARRLLAPPTGDTDG